MTAGHPTAGTDADEPAAVLDCLGMKCPRPIIELARVIGHVPVGRLIEVLADDPAAGPDIGAWCRMQRHELVESAGIRFRVRRRG